MRHLERGEVDVTLRPHREVVQMDRRNNGFRLIARNAFDGGLEIVFADAVILATGYAFAVPDFLAPLRGRLPLDRHGSFALAEDFSLKWDGPRQNRIFALNAGKFSHGVAEPQLSLMAWRSATIVNALLGAPHFDLDLPPPLLHWSTTGDGYRQAVRSGVASAGS
jgi:lysine N6-hydroxylase